jgi:hypothetical protein
MLRADLIPPAMSFRNLRQKRRLKVPDDDQRSAPGV